MSNLQAAVGHAQFGKIEDMPEQPGRRRLAGVHGGAYDRQEGDWGLDGFAPAGVPGEEEPQGTGRAEVHGWR